MKKSVLRLAPIALLVVTLAACAGTGPAVSVADAEQALYAGFGATIAASMSAAVGRPLPGVDLNQQSGALTLREFDVTDFETIYRTVSGTVTASSGASRVDLTLTGGPVQSLRFELTAAQMQDPGGFSTSVRVNRRAMELTIPSEWFQ
ncbi:MAG: hypothetical protein EA382_14350 [Spirochaetaceae bacterium]|nr:MAG: hypothetical protein EA382_14350 [Spirochaetaceae bacterium]